MKKIILDIYSFRCRYYRSKWVDAMDHMEKYIYEDSNGQFQKYRKRYAKYKMKWLHSIRKFKKFSTTWC